MRHASPVQTDLTHLLKALRLPTIRTCYSEAADQARQEELAYEAYLHRSGPA